MSNPVEVDGREAVALRADQVQEGDTVHVDGKWQVCWGTESLNTSQTILYIHGFEQDFVPESKQEWNSNPIWVSAYDAQVTGRISK